MRAAMCEGTVADRAAFLNRVIDPLPEFSIRRRIDTVMLLPTDDPLSLRHAEPAQEPVRPARRSHARR